MTILHANADRTIQVMTNVKLTGPGRCREQGETVCERRGWEALGLV